MKLRRSQTQAFNNIVKYGKAFIFWGRQTGKSYLLSHIIQDFAAITKSSDILFFCDQKNHIKIYQDKVLKDIPKSVRKSKPGEITLFNNNYLTFCSIKEYDYYLRHLNPSLIIFDNYLIKDFSLFNNLILYILEHNNCKCIFTSYKIDFKLVKILDQNNNFYINIMANDNEYPITIVDDRDKLIITQDVLEYLATKPDELIDYDDLIFKRRKKLKQLKLLSEENES
jgi:hypothetical protein